MRRFHWSLLLGLLLVALGIGIVFFQKPQSSPAETVTKVAPSIHLPRPKRTLRVSPSSPAFVINLPTISAPTPPPESQDSSENQEWVTSQVFEMERLAWFDDPESLSKILAELKSSAPEIREAALNATVNSGSRAAVPYLQKISAETQDAAQRKSIDEAIAYLNLPTLVESLDEDAYGKGKSAPPKLRLTPKTQH